jgi:UDP-2,3-diacylglucosamine pyrophosphatase LpxH
MKLKEKSNTRELAYEYPMNTGDRQMSHSFRYRTIWLSDVHLGSRACRIDLLLDFLARHRCEQLYLVGDIIDLERMRKWFYWPKAHTAALQQILEMARAGTRVVYVPGNHDHDFRVMAGSHLGPIEVHRETVHETADGRRLLVLHGDEFDSALRCGPLASLVGCTGYGLLLGLNRLIHGVNALMGRPYWSLAQAVKMRIGNAARYVARFQEACIEAARDAGLDGVVCGHIHRADLVERGGLIYCNDGDWVESCTALVEDDSGELELIQWGQSTEATADETLTEPLRDAA